MQRILALLRNPRKTGAESPAPPKGLPGSFAVWRRVSAPFALLSKARKTIAPVSAPPKGLVSSFAAWRCAGALVLFVIALPLTFGALSGTIVYGATPTHKASSAQRGPTPGDAQIDATIRAKLAKSKIGKDGFRFKVQRGVVTWEGSTEVMQHKGSATRMARTAGAAQVINNIQVSSMAKARAAGNLKRAQVIAQ